MSSGEHTAARGRTTTGELEFTRGASELRIHAEQDPGRLFTAKFHGHQPTVSVARATVSVRYPHSALPTSGEVALNPAVIWVIQAHGGAHDIDAGLTNVPIASLGISGGASRVTLRLSEPNGWVPIRIGGGASNVTILRPPHVGARLRVKRGAAHLTFDEQRLGAVGGLIRFESSPDGMTTGYDIHVASGANRLTVATG
jgi:hypothetical protein